MLNQVKEDSTYRAAVLTAPACLILLGLVLGCAPQPPEHIEPVNVAVSIYPLADWVNHIGKECVEVTCLLPEGENPYQYTPGDTVARIRPTVEIVFKIGRGLDDWLEKTPVLKNEASPQRVVVLTERMPRISSISPELGHRDELAEKDVDPHNWLDPVGAQQMVLHIARELSRLRPEAEKYFLHNAETYMKEVYRLHVETRDALSGLSQRRIVALHSSFLYFSHRYNLNLVHVIESKPGVPPSPEREQAIVETLTQMNNPCIFVDAGMDATSARQIAQKTGARLVTVDPFGSPDDPHRNSYLALMRYNVQQFRTALSGEDSGVKP